MDHINTVEKELSANKVVNPKEMAAEKKSKQN